MHITNTWTVPSKIMSMTNKGTIAAGISCYGATSPQETQVLPSPSSIHYCRIVTLRNIMKAISQGCHAGLEYRVQSASRSFLYIPCLCTILYCITYKCSLRSLSTVLHPPSASFCRLLRSPTTTTIWWFRCTPMCVMYSHVCYNKMLF